MIRELLSRMAYKIIGKYSNREQLLAFTKSHFQPMATFPVSASEFQFAADGLYTIHNADFIHDSLFAESYKLGKETGSWGEANVQWRAYVACWAAATVKHLPGDFVECGVNRGGLSRTIINYVDFNSLKKTFFLLDTFNGLVEKYISDAEKRRGIHSGGYEECYEAVKNTFSPFNVKIIQGAVPDTLDKVVTNKICYLSIDMNCVEPEIAAANFFWNKLVPGGIMLLDDYGWSFHFEQKQAFDRFALEKDIQILSLPTGQGLIIKP